MEPSQVVNLLPGIHDVLQIKKGGQKTVYRAQSDQYGDVVVKLMRGTARIEREIAIVKNHAFVGVPRIYEFGDLSSESEFSKYIIEQRVDGDDLKKTLLTRKDLITTSFVIRMMRSILKTLCELEIAKIVHRDIKPDNIVYDRRGAFWLLDFGIARDMSDVSLTCTDAANGPCTPGYGAPEQVLNFKSEIDIRADLYSLGVTAYELIVGENPFHKDVNNPIGAMAQSVTLEADTLEIAEDESGNFAQFVKMLMNKQKTFRPPSARQALEWFEAVVKGIA